MKHLELHILQSFPVACLNRDDLNSPKTAIFGGVQRARVSSQSWKSVIRKLAKESLPNMEGQRTKLVVAQLAKLLGEGNLKPEICTCLAEIAASHISKLDSKKDAAGFLKVTTLCFLSDAEFKAISKSILDDKNEKLHGAITLLNDALIAEPKDEKAIEKAKKSCETLITKDAVGKAIKSAQLKDAADIALFGRMVANDHSLTLEGAAMFSHALSTHKIDNEIDFFSAVDNMQPSDEAGAGMTGTLEFNSATYYRFAALNIDMLADEEHLQALTREERQKIVRAFIEATLKAVPIARKNSMNAATLPGYVLGIVRNSGHPVQLVNAFEKPLRAYAGKGLFELSMDELKKEYGNLNKIWGLNERKKANGEVEKFELECIAIPDIDLDAFLDRMTAHVD